MKIKGVAPAAGALSTTIVDVNASAGAQVALGFTLNADNSGLANLVIDGAGTPQATRGIWVTVGSTTNTTLDHVVVRNFAADGIVVGGAPTAANNGSGTVTISGGTQSVNNGSTGMTVTGIASATITGTAGGNAASGNQIAFSGNKSHGILVYLGGHIVLTGTPAGSSAWSDGTVVANFNGPAGLNVAQQQTGTALPMNDVNGLVSYGTTGGNALRVEGGSNLKLYNSVALASKGNGILVATYAHAGLTSSAPNDVSHIDLGGGTNGSPGKNVFQQPPTGSDASADTPNNKNAGICLSVTPDSSQALSAKNSTLITLATPATSVDCSQAGSFPVSYSRTCGKLVAVGIGGQAQVDPSATANSIAIQNCTYH